jgi:hypothetical protein
MIRYYTNPENKQKRTKISCLLLWLSLHFIIHIGYTGLDGELDKEHDLFLIYAAV